MSPTPLKACVLDVRCFGNRSPFRPAPNKLQFILKEAACIRWKQVKEGNEGGDNRYIHLLSHSISHPVMSTSFDNICQFHGKTMSQIWTSHSDNIFEGTLILGCLSAPLNLRGFTHSSHSIFLFFYFLLFFIIGICLFRVLTGKHEE